MARISQSLGLGRVWTGRESWRFKSNDIFVVPSHRGSTSLNAILFFYSYLPHKMHPAGHWITQFFNGLFLTVVEIRTFERPNIVMSGVEFKLCDHSVCIYIRCSVDETFFFVHRLVHVIEGETGSLNLCKRSRRNSWRKQKELREQKT